MRKTFFAMLLVVVIGGMVGCADEPSAITQPENINETTIDLSVTRTIGNHTYIPLNIDGAASKNITVILAVLDAFEKTRPELEITSWSLLNDQVAYVTRPWVYGIWVNHKPKTATQAPASALNHYFQHLVRTMEQNADIKSRFEYPMRTGYLLAH